MRLPKQLLKRKPDSHKGDFGHVFILAGSTGMTGAAYLCAQAAIRCGAGLVTLGIPKSLNPIMEVKLTEVMTLPLAEAEEGSLSLKAFSDIRDFSEKADCVAIGPGLSQNKSTQELIRKSASAIKKPIVLDADGINAFEGYTSLLKSICRRGVHIITPHPGEMARLLKISVREAQGDREKIAADFSRRYNLTVVLKGYKTIIASGKSFHVNKTGNPGMASGGCGDVLTGMIASFLAQGMSAYEASKAAVYLHGLAGDLAKKDKTEISLIASDIIDKIPNIFKKLGVK